MGRLRLPRLLSDGMVLQQNKEICIWGEDEPGREVTVALMGEEYVCTVNDDGEWEVYLPKMRAGGTLEMVIRDDAGEETVIKDILVGDVWICSGQSNMELPIRRVIDQYPYERENCINKCIRTFKITEHGDFHAPLKDHLSGEWKSVDRRSILDFSATGYFFAKHLYQVTGVPVGFINASLGGSRIESWMSRDMIKEHVKLLALADEYSDDRVIEEALRRNQRESLKWHKSLDRMDLGLQENWRKDPGDESAWKKVDIPFFFKDTALKDFIGSVWFRREFTVGKQFTQKRAKLWLGTIVDSDTVYINGVEVGHTDYQYPPRKYVVPRGVLKEGKNVIVIRVKCEIGLGRFTDNKTYALFQGDEQIGLTGTWEYRIGASCKKIKETNFVNWKPTGLYNGMMAPCSKYKIAGVVWYQGEANSRQPRNYRHLMKQMIKGYREMWGEEMPFFYVQLPNFDAEVYDLDRRKFAGDWPAIREHQRRILSIPDTAMAVAYDIGEDNDLHPLNKERVGFRLAMLAASKLYGEDMECEGPQYYKVIIRKLQAKNKEGKAAWRVSIKCYHATNMYAKPGDKGTEIKDFEIIDNKGESHEAEVEFKRASIILTCEDEMESIREVRYCYHNTSRGALIYNEEGFPMAPFRYIVKYGGNKRNKPH